MKKNKFGAHFIWRWAKKNLIWRAFNLAIDEKNLIWRALNLAISDKNHQMLDQICTNKVINPLRVVQYFIYALQ